MKKSTLFAAICAAAVLGACGSSDKQSEAQQPQEESKPIVKLEQVATQPVAQIQEYTGTVEAEVKNNIAPSSPVRIEKIFVEVGDRVSKGQKLVQMDASNLRQLELQIENLRTEFKRIDELYKVGGVSKSDWDKAKTNLDVNETAYKDRLVNTQLASPINGIVTARNYDNGDMYSGAQPVLTVEQIQPVKLMVNVSEGYFTKVKKGDKASVKLDVYSDEEFTATVKLVYPTIDKNTRTFPVELSLPNQESRIRPGMFARVTMNFGSADRVVVPDRAVIKQTGSGDKYVYVYNNGAVSYDKVELGRRLGDKYEVVSGLSNGAQVVVAGQSRLHNGSQVEVK